MVNIIIIKDSGATLVGHVFEKLKEYNIGIHVNAKVKEITDTQIKFNDEVLDVDQVIVIGDENSPRRILDATREAYVATYKL